MNRRSIRQSLRQSPRRDPPDVKTIALFSIKGGVGKTAAAVNLAHLAAREGTRTLLWDLDAQGAASFHLRVRPKLGGGVRRLVKRKNRLAERIKARS